MKNNKIAILLTICFLILLFFVQFYFRKYIHLEDIKESAYVIGRYVNKHYLWSVFLYISIMAGATIVALPITIIGTVAAGYFFGILVGSIYALIGVTFGSFLLFLCTRHVWGIQIQDYYGHKLENINEKVKKYGWQAIVALQLLPATPTFLLNVAAGLSQLSSLVFISATLIGLAPGTIIYAWAGDRLFELKDVNEAVSFLALLLFIMLGVLVIIPALVYRRIQNGR